jgi:hypothetical protein
MRVGNNEYARADAIFDEHEWEQIRKQYAVAGVGTDAPTVVNKQGAMQSHSPYRVDLSPPLATLHIAEVLGVGAKKYGAWNWLGIPMHDHLNHALVHAFAYLAGDTSDDHIGHFACRAMMALEIHQRDRRMRDATPTSSACRTPAPAGEQQAAN